MSSFYAGQPVKKVRGLFNVGNTGAYVGPAPIDPDDDRDCYIRPDSACVMYYEDGEVCGIGAPGVARLACSHEWEPILPPGLESLEEINALYEPSPERVRESVR